MTESDKYLFCPNCGAKYAPSENHYCGICGTALIERGAKRKYPENLPGTQKEFRFLWELANIVVFVGVVEIVLGWVLPIVANDWISPLLSALPASSARALETFQYLPGLVLFLKLNGDGIITIAVGEFIKVQVRQNDHLQSVEQILRWFDSTAIKNE